MFTTRDGRPLDSPNTTKDFQELLAKAGLPRPRFHDFRHAFATELIGQGEELAAVSKLLGRIARGAGGPSGRIGAHQVSTRQEDGASPRSTLM